MLDFVLLHCFIGLFCFEFFGCVMFGVVVECVAGWLWFVLFLFGVWVWRGGWFGLDDGVC